MAHKHSCEVGLLCSSLTCSTFTAVRTVFFAVRDYCRKYAHLWFSLILLCNHLTYRRNMQVDEQEVVCVINTFLFSHNVLICVPTEFLDIIISNIISNQLEQLSGGKPPCNECPTLCKYTNWLPPCKSTLPAAPWTCWGAVVCASERAPSFADARHYCLVWKLPEIWVLGGWVGEWVGEWERVGGAKSRRLVLNGRSCLNSCRKGRYYPHPPPPPTPTHLHTYTHTHTPLNTMNGDKMM